MTKRLKNISLEEKQSELIREIVRRIVETVQPRRVILFGSAARGDMRPDSDLDFLVVMPDGAHRRHTAQRIHRSLWGTMVASDIVVVTESDIGAYRWNYSLVLRPALEEGKVVYGA